MADPLGAASPAAGETAAGEAALPATTHLHDLGDDGEIATPQGWREDWRESLAGADKSFLSTLKRYATPENFAKSWREQQKKLSSRPAEISLPENATPDEIAAHRKALGVPETPEGYKFAFPAEMETTEGDATALTAFAEHMHARNVPPAAAKAAFDFYVEKMASGQAERAASAEAATLENLVELRAEFKGREFARNMRLADELLMKHFGDDQTTLDAVNEVLATRLASGVQVMNYAPFMKGLFAMARAQADEESLIGGDGAGGGKSMDDEYHELIKEGALKPLPAAKQARLMELAEARVAREERQGRRTGRP